jgi:NADPH:quinone reductase-like Zn-dependent oxidoreductase
MAEEDRVEQTMRAVGFRRYGPAEVLESLEVPRPAIGPGTVLLRVAAAGVNPADGNIRSGRFRFFARLRLPFVPGSDVAGVVAEVGPGVTRFQPGDEVYALLPTITAGAYAEYAAVREADLAHAPAGLALDAAAALPLAGLTALQALRDQAALRPGQRLLVNGASGGVGSLAVQIGRQLGAHVTGVCSGRNVALVRGLGADEVVDYTREDPSAAGRHADVVFDAVGLGTFRAWRRVADRDGTVVTVNPVRGNPVLRVWSRLLGGPRLRSLFVRPSGPDLELLAAWVAQGRLRPVVERSCPLGDAVAAHRQIETQRTRGKLVLVVDEELARRQVARAGTRPHAV